MTALSDLKPTERHRVIDLVREAGLDVSDWANCAGGAAKAAANPKYCYEWCFGQPGRAIVINLWYDAMVESGGVIWRECNFRADAKEHARRGETNVWVQRAERMDAAIKSAVQDNLPIRVIVCDGQRRNRDEPDAAASQVDCRMLDPVPWGVTAYDPGTGQCTLTRGAPSARFADQFSAPEVSTSEPTRRQISGDAFVRAAAVRTRALARANGKCEWCQQAGFKMADGRTYMETHHIVPLSEGGPDEDSNVAALCPNHHREAHHGLDKQKMRATLMSRPRKGDTTICVQGAQVVGTVSSSS